MLCHFPEKLLKRNHSVVQNGKLQYKQFLQQQVGATEANKVNGRNV